MGTIKINAAITIQSSFGRAERGYIEVNAAHSRLMLHVRVAVTLRDELRSRAVQKPRSAPGPGHPSCVIIDMLRDYRS